MTQWKQSSWGWVTALAMFLEGLCGATILLGVLLGSAPGVILGVIWGIAAGLVLLAEAGNPRAAFRLMSGLGHAWMSRGTLLIVLCIVFGLAYALPAVPGFAWLPWTSETILGRLLGVLVGVSSLLLMAYPGFLLGSMKPFPLWASSGSPIISLTGSLLGGLGLFLLGDQLAGEAFPILNFAGSGLAILQLLFFWGYLDTALRGAATESASAHLLLRMPVFLWGAVIIGLVVPLVLLGAALALPGVTSSALRTVAGVLLVVGWFCQRTAILGAGLR
ncbi:MAG: polysulfide reductase NrfD, partial [Anaerolineae bacterium]|nr:polysulfide reductase NrfD [Anaerolineae bacterium]